MRIKNISDQILYVPNRNKGLSEFSGRPLASQEVFKLIKLEGVDFITQKLSEFIEIRKEMFGHAEIDLYGLQQVQRFFDLKNRVVLKVVELIDTPSKDFTIELNEFQPLITRTKIAKTNISAFRFVKSGLFLDNFS